ncbi:MAG: glycerophosphodiester phosphodiesterase family protein [Pirellula sp.]|jgi:glycerophosphoryl diester phosphodiesterase
MQNIENTKSGSKELVIHRKRWFQPVANVLVALWLFAPGLGVLDSAIVFGQTKVIAHRGASGYCVEHSEGAKALAHAQRADYIEQDVVLSKDRVFVVLHDLTLDATTNVKAIYPERARTDGKYYVADFTWDELKELELRGRVADKMGGCGQRIMRLDHEITFLRQLDRAFHRKTGLYIELKGAGFHKKEFGVSMGDELLKVLAKLEVASDPESCLIQCFEPDELVALHENGCPYKLIQLIGDRYEGNIDELAKYAYGVGPPVNLLANKIAGGKIVSSGFVERAKRAGLKVHPYTVRLNMQPKWSDSIDETHRVLADLLKVDGFFTDYPDLGRSAVDGHSK